MLETLSVSHDRLFPFFRINLGLFIANIKGNGLVPMKSLAHTFVQFACSAKETVDDDLFFKHLLRNLNRENVPISTVFQDIAEDVYDERGSEQKLYQDGLSNVNSVYLNEVKQERCT